jgi:hypothetical protein
LLAASQAGSQHHMDAACRLVTGAIRLARGDLPGAMGRSAAGRRLPPGVGAGAYLRQAEQLLAELAASA